MRKRVAAVVFCVAVAAAAADTLGRPRELYYMPTSSGLHIVALPEGWRPATDKLVLKSGRGDALICRAEEGDCQRMPLLPSEERDVVLRAEPREYEYLVITPRSFRDDEVLARFVKAKERAGLRVRVAVEEEIPIGRTADPADGLRRWLAAERRRARFLFLLLIGTPDPRERPVALTMLGRPQTMAASAPFRVHAGLFSEDEPPNATLEQGAEYLLEAEDLRVDAAGALTDVMLNAKRPGRLELDVWRREGGRWRRTDEKQMVYFAVGHNVLDLKPVEVRAGEAVSFRLEEGALWGWRRKAPALRVVAGEAAKDVERVVPALRLYGFRATPADEVGTLPMKVLYPMGTYNANAYAYALDRHWWLTPSDAPYAAPEADWDADRDGCFGEAMERLPHWDDLNGGRRCVWDSGDGEVPLPQIAVGRIPFDPRRDPDAVRAALERAMAPTPGDAGLLAVETLAPDTQMPDLPGWLRRLTAPLRWRTLYVERPWSGHLPRPVRGYDLVVPWERLKDDREAAAAELVRAWREEKPGLVLLLSHGNMDLCGRMLPLRLPPEPRGEASLKYIEALKGVPPTHVAMMACNAGQPEPYYLGRREDASGVRHNWERRPVLANSLLGAVAATVLAHTRGSWPRRKWTTPRSGGCQTLLCFYVAGLAGGLPAGVAYRNACWRYAALASRRFTDAANIAGFTLFGDPAAGLRSGAPVLTLPALPDAWAGRPYEVELEVAGGRPPYTMELDGRLALPKGLRLENGRIAGTPATHGGFSVPIVVTDSEGRRTRHVLPLLVRPTTHLRTGNVYLKFASRLPLAVSDFFMSHFFESAGHLCAGGGQTIRAAARMRRPVLLLGSGALHFSFRAAMDPGNDILTVEASRDGVDWRVLWATTGDGELKEPDQGTRPVWRQARVDLNVMGCGALLLRFRYESHEPVEGPPRQGVRIKDILLSGRLAVQGGTGAAAAIRVVGHCPVGFKSGRIEGEPPGRRAGIR